MAGDKENFTKLMNQGHSVAWDQNWEKAAGFYRQALQEFPDDSKALSSLALALYESGNLPEALSFYQRAARVTPEDPIPLEKVAELLERLNRTDQAVDAYMRSADLYVKNRDVNKGIDLWLHVITLNPEYLMAHSRLALIYERLGRKPDAVKEYLMVAGLMQHAGDVQRAAQAATHALQILPESTDVAQALNNLKNGRPLPRPVKPRPSTDTQVLIAGAVKSSKARQAKKEAEESPDPIADARQKALASLAGMLFEQDDSQSVAAPSGLQSLMRGDGQTSNSTSAQIDPTKVLIHLSQAIDCLSRKEDGRAVEELEKASAAGLEHPAVFYIQGTLMMEAGRMESGLRILQRVVHAPDFALAARLLAGQTYLKMNRLRESAVELMEALRLADMHAVAPEQAEALGRLYDPLIDAYSQPGEEAPAPRLSENILEMLVRANWLERVKQARQQLPAAEADGEMAPLADLVTQSGSSQIVESLSHIQRLSRAGKYRTAMEEAFNAINYAPTYLPLHSAIAELLLKQGLVEDAGNKMRVIASSYIAREEYGRAVSMYRRLVELAPMDLQGRSRLIELMVSSAQGEEAVEEYLRLADIHYSLADLTMVRQTLTDALAMAQEMGLGKASRVKLLLRLADLDLQSLDWRQALRWYEQIRSLQPDDEAARAILVDLHFRLGQVNPANNEITSYVKLLLDRRAVDKAIIFLEKIYEEHQDQPFILRQLGDLYRQAGKTELALQRYDLAGELFLSSGNKKAAAETIMTILTLNPPNAADYQQLLAQLRSE